MLPEERVAPTRFRGWAACGGVPGTAPPGIHAPAAFPAARLRRVHSTFNIVIWVVCILAVVIAFGALIASRKTWEDFGKGRFVMDREESRSGPGAALAERDAEIRQLLEARNARRERRGEAPLDVEAELTRLTAPAVDPALRE